MTAPQSPPTPTVPPLAVVQWHAEQRATSPLRRTLVLADVLVAEAEAAGVALRSVDVEDRWSPTVYLRAADASLTPALAVALGLTERRVSCYSDTESIESFEGEVGGVWVRCQHALPTAALAADEPVRSAS